MESNAAYNELVKINKNLKEISDNLKKLLDQKKS